MSSERIDKIKTYLRYAAAIFLLVLASIQLADKIMDSVRTSRASPLALAISVLLFVLPMLLGLALYRSLTKAFEDGVLATKWRHICIDWLIMLLLSSYITIGRWK